MAVECQVDLGEDGPAEVNEALEEAEDDDAAVGEVLDVGDAGDGGRHNLVTTRTLSSRGWKTMERFPALVIIGDDGIFAVGGHFGKGVGEIFMLFNRHPDYTSLSYFGCRSYPYLRDYGKNKFSPRYR